MSDGSLSQDEIDALLQGGGGGDPGAPGGGGASSGGGISDEAIGKFSSLLESVVGGQSSNLSGLMGDKTVTIGNPDVAGIDEEGLRDELDDSLVQITINYGEAVEGTHSYIMSSSDAAKFAGFIVGQDQVEMGEMALEALKEALSTITGVALNTFGDAVGGTIMPSPAEAVQNGKEGLDLPGEAFGRANYSVTVEGEDPIQLLEIFDANIINTLTGTEEEAPQPAPAAGAGGAGIDMGDMDALLGGGGQGAGGGQAGQQQQDFGGMGGMMMPGQSQPNVQSVQFPGFNQQASGAGESGNISLLMDVYMEMTVELGRTKKPIKEILGMGEGTIIELDKLAGEPVDILVNHKLIATGEVVVIDENFGVRVTEIVSPVERMKDLT
jgi:flagellar motor switch protein FliN